MTMSLNDIYNVQTPQTLSTEGLPEFMRGAQYVRDRETHDKAMALKQLMDQAGVERTQALQPSAIASGQAQNQATALTAVPEAIHRTEAARLGNIKTKGDIKTADIDRQIKERQEAMDHMGRVLEAGAMIQASGGSPAALAQFKQSMSGMGDNALTKFLMGATDTQDFFGRLNHLKQVREKVNLEWAKLKNARDVAAMQAEATKTAAAPKDSDWTKARNNLYNIYRARGMGHLEALELATREVMNASKQPSPIHSGETALAEKNAAAAAKIDEILPFITDEKLRKRLEEQRDKLKSSVKTAPPGGGLGAAGGATSPVSTGDAKMKQAVEAAGGTYEPDKFDYRIGPNGNVQRKPKGS